MHPYSTDSRERETVPLYLAAAAIASALLLSVIFKEVDWAPPAWLDAPSTIAFYGMYYQVFRKWIWRWPILRTIGLIKVPYLAGTWNGHVVTTYDELKGKHEVRVIVKQDWTHFQFSLSSKHSQSKSTIGGILVQDGIAISYEYLNEPLSNALDTMHTHRGSVRLALSEDGETLSGDYFTGRDRTNYGSLFLKRSNS